MEQGNQMILFYPTAPSDCQQAGCAAPPALIQAPPSHPQPLLGSSGPSTPSTGKGRPAQVGPGLAAWPAKLQMLSGLSPAEGRWAQWSRPPCHPGEERHSEPRILGRPDDEEN